MQTLEQLLSEHPFFQGLEPRYLQLIAGCASNAHFDTGQFIFHEGEDANRFYLIRHGKVSLDVFIPGRGPVSLQTIGADDVLGWSWLFPPYRWLFDARALEPTRVTAFDGICLRSKCAEDHDLGYELMNRFAYIITQRLQATRLQILDVYGVRM